MTNSSIKLDQGIHVIHLFYRVDRVRWAQLSPVDSTGARTSVEQLCAKYSAASHPRLVSYANVCGKADLVFMIYAAELGLAAQIHRDLEQCFPPGAIERVYNYLSI